MIEELEAAYQNLIDNGYVTDGDTQLHSAVSNKLNPRLTNIHSFLWHYLLFTHQEISCFNYCLFGIAMLSSAMRHKI